jgi:hypothetical protein
MVARNYSPPSRNSLDFNYSIRQLPEISAILD